MYVLICIFLPNSLYIFTFYSVTVIIRNSAISIYPNCFYIWCLSNLHRAFNVWHVLIQNALSITLLRKCLNRKTKHTYFCYITAGRCLRWSLIYCCALKKWFDCYPERANSLPEGNLRSTGRCRIWITGQLPAFHFILKTGLSDWIRTSSFTEEL